MKEQKIISFIGLNSCIIIANVSKGEFSPILFTILALIWFIIFILTSRKKQ